MDYSTVIELDNITIQDCIDMYNMKEEELKKILENEKMEN